MKESYDKIGPTAKLVAYLRTFTDIPFAKEIAVESGAKKTFQELAAASAKSMVRLAPLWEARYKVTDRILVENDMTQVLEIAAGLSPRGLSMTENSNIVYVVTDLPQILEEEKKIAETILAKSNSRRLNLHFQVANVLDMKSLSTAAAAFKHNKPLAIISEGLFPYLNRAEKKVFADNVHELLRKYHGLWIASDVHTKQHLQEISRLDLDTQTRLTNISNSTERTIENNIFDDEDDIKRYFGAAGFTMEEYLHSSVFENYPRSNS